MMLPAQSFPSCAFQHALTVQCKDRQERLCGPSDEVTAVMSVNDKNHSEIRQVFFFCGCFKRQA